MKQDRIPYQHISVHQVERDPQGIFEKIGSKWFHKTYYTSEKRTETRYSTFDIGVNDNEVAQNIVLQLESVFSGEVDHYIDYLTKGYYGPVETLQRRTTDEIRTAIAGLEEMRM